MDKNTKKYEKTKVIIRKRIKAEAPPERTLGERAAT